MSDMLERIESGIANLRQAIKFDIYEFNNSQQEAMLHRLDEIENVVNKVKEGM